MIDRVDKKIVLLDGRASGDEDLTPLLALLTTVLKQGGAQVQIFSLREMKLARCIGCYSCFVETPGICRYGETDGHTILQAVIQSDTVILFTPVVFGGYSSQLKQIVDRFVSLILPSFRTSHGEVHHASRYARFPRLVALGVQHQLNAEDAALFKLVVGRNAINFHAPSYAAEVVSSMGDPDRLRAVFQSLLKRHEPFPRATSVKSLMPAPDVFLNYPHSAGGRRACLIVGSPKTLSPSTSSVLGNYLLERLKEQGWETESLTLKAGLGSRPGETALLAAVDRADLLLFAFPLYIDALPYLMTKALEIIANHRQTADHRRPQRLFAIANNGFPEAYQTHLALSICQRFAAETGLTWVGGLAMGAGETLCGGQPLKATGTLAPVPLGHVIGALDATAAALARGQAVPAEATRRIARNPIPYTPFLVWRTLFVRGAQQWWESQAAEHGVSKQAMLARPYARDAALEEPLPVS